MKKMKKHEERRRAPRIEFKVPLPARYRIIDGKNEKLMTNWALGSIVNLNLLGACVMLSSLELDGLHVSFDELLITRNFLEIEIDLQSGFGIMKVLGQVEWYELMRGRDALPYNAGVSFKSMSVEDR